MFRNNISLFFTSTYFFTLWLRIEWFVHPLPGVYILWTFGTWFSTDMQVQS